MRTVPDSTGEFPRVGSRDKTEYVYADLSIDDADHAGSDDVRALAMAVAEVAEVGLDEWLGVALSSPLIDDGPELRDVVQRGLKEMEALLQVSRSNDRSSLSSGSVSAAGCHR